MSDLQDPGHNDVRNYLRTLGPALALLGLIFTAIGMGSFFSTFLSFGSPGSVNFGPPRFFWCAFVGLPLLAVGIGISKFAYIGSIARYIADETAPVAKDTANYMVDGTKDSIREVASAIGEGFLNVRSTDLLQCQKCGTNSDPSSNFCRQCGAPFPKTKYCAKCGESNLYDARFCDHCGAAVA